tara:strand:+ start:5028 stop:7274 length:2247 start_codon:yes stop_codon:yes gene_type:complete
MARELPKNQLRPTAKPVNTFLSYRSEQPVAPPKLVEMPTPKGINIIQRSNEMSVQGYNSFKQLSDALAKTSQAVSQIGPVVKSNEEQKGRNDVIKALTLANRQAINNAENYAATNRQVSREDAIAGMMMDEVNPWRQKSREDQLSRLAAGEAGIYFDRAFNQYASEIISLDPLNPRLDQIKAEAVTQLAQDWGVDETSASFIDYTTPAINKAWQGFNEKHLKGYTKFQKEFQKTLTKGQLYQALVNWKKDELTENDLVAQLGVILNDQVKKLGLPLEPTEFKKEVLLALRGQLEVEANDINGKHSQRAASFLGMLDSVPVHIITDKKGRPKELISAGEMFGVDFLLEQNKIGNAAHQINKRKEEAAEKDFVLKWAETIVPLEKGSDEYNAAVSELFADENLPFDKKIKLFADIDEMDEARAKTTFNTAPVEEIFSLNQSRHGVKFDENAVRKELTEALAGVPPELAEYKSQKWKEFATMARQKRTEASGAYETSIINKKIKEATQLQVETYYKDIGPLYQDENLDLSKLDTNAYMSNLKPNRQGGAMTYSQALEDKVYADLTSEINERGSLDPAEQTKVIVNSITEFNKDKEAVKNMFPLPEKQIKKEDKAVDAPPTYRLSSLDVVPDSRIEKRDYKEFPIMSANDTQKVLKLALDGEKIPMPMRSLANKYNISPFQLLVDTLEHYKDEEFYPSEEDKNFLLQKGNKLMGLKNSVKGMSPGDGQLSDATNYVAYVLSGTAPKRLIYRG